MRLKRQREAIAAQSRALQVSCLLSLTSLQPSHQVSLTTAWWSRVAERAGCSNHPAGMEAACPAPSSPAVPEEAEGAT